MNGAQSLLKILVEADIEVCFANPGTSEMHLVLAIGKTDTVAAATGARLLCETFPARLQPLTPVR